MQAGAARARAAARTPLGSFSPFMKRLSARAARGARARARVSRAAGTGWSSTASPTAAPRSRRPSHLDHTLYNADIIFYSDYSVAYAGFEICMLDDPPPSPTPTPAPTPPRVATPPRLSASTLVTARLAACASTRPTISGGRLRSRSRLHHHGARLRVARRAGFPNRELVVGLLLRRRDRRRCHLLRIQRS